MSKKSDARRKAIKSLKSEMKKDAHGNLADKLQGKMSVKVMADSPEELKEGLEKAEDMLEMGEGKKEGIAGMLKEAFDKRAKKPKKEDQ